MVTACLWGWGGGFVCESVGRADLLSDHFDSKQSGESVDLPLTCHPYLRHTTIAFRSSEVRLLLLTLDRYEGTDSLGIFTSFFKRTANVLVSGLSVVFRWLVRQGTMCQLGTHFMVPYLVPVRVKLGALVSHVHFCGSSLQSLAIPHDFNSYVSISVERSC